MKYNFLMIIRPQKTQESPQDTGDEFSFDLERIGYIARKKAGLLMIAALIGSGFGLAVAFYKFSKPVETRLKTEVLFVGNPGVTEVTGVTGVKEIDAVLSTFDPQINLQEIIQYWAVGSLLKGALQQSGLSLADSKSKSDDEGEFNPSKTRHRTFWVNDKSGKRVRLLIDWQSSRDRPVQMIVQGALPKEKLKDLGANILRAFNELWSQKALDLARTQKSYAEKVRSQLVKEPAGAVENLPRLGQAIQITADFSLLSNYQRIRLIDQFLEKLKDWPSGIIFAYPGKQTSEQLRPTRVLWLLPIVVGAGFLVGVLGFYSIFAEMAGTVLGERDLAEIHPAASIYPAKLGSAELVHLLAASFARSGRDKPGKLAAFVPQAESGLIEKIRLAAESSDHTFSKDDSANGEVCLFTSADPSSWLARLPSQGFARILLISQKGVSLKSRHMLYQAEGDLAGIPITDVILIEG